MHETPELTSRLSRRCPRNPPIVPSTTLLASERQCRHHPMTQIARHHCGLLRLASPRSQPETGHGRTVQVVHSRLLAVQARRRPPQIVRLHIGQADGQDFIQQVASLHHQIPTNSRNKIYQPTLWMFCNMSQQQDYLNSWLEARRTVRCMWNFCPSLHRKTTSQSAPLSDSKQSAKSRWNAPASRRNILPRMSIKVMWRITVNAPWLSVVPNCNCNIYVTNTGSAITPARFMLKQLLIFKPF